MKISVLKSEVSVPIHIKTFALVLALLDPMYSGTRNDLIKRLVLYYGVSL